MEIPKIEKASKAEIKTFQEEKLKGPFDLPGPEFKVLSKVVRRT